MGYLSTTPVDLTTAWVQIAAANEPFLFQRISGYDVIYQIAEIEPDAESMDGHRLNDYKPVGFTASNPVWVRSDGDSVLLVSVGEVISANQTTLQGTQGTGASYDPPTGGSGVFGWLSGIHKGIVSGVKLKLGGADISASNPMPVQNPNAAPIDRSSSITTGGAAQVAAAALSTRKAYFFQNISSENMWGSFVGTAAPNTAGSFPIFPNGVIRSTQVCETTVLSIYGATTGQKYTMWEM